MIRRRYLALLGAVSLAGCTGGEQADGQAGTTAEPMTPQDQAEADSGTPTDSRTPTEAETPTDSPEPTDTETATPTEQASVNLEVGDPELVTIERSYGEYPGGEVRVTNTGTGPTKAVECTFDWFDTDGEYLDSGSAYIRTLGAGETWAAREVARGLDAEVGGVEVAASTDAEAAVLGLRDVSLSNTQFRASTNNVLLRGRATNERDSEIRYVEAVGKVYDADGTLLTTGYTNETELAAGASWDFEIEPRTDGRNDQVETGSIVLTDGLH